MENHKNYSNVQNLYEIAALYTIAIAQSHTFNDGNKRTALSCMSNFLILNGVSFVVSEDEIEQMMVDVAEKKVSHTELTAWVKTYATCESFEIE